MEQKPSKVVYSNEGETKVILIGKWFGMTGEEIAKDYEDRLAAGDQLMININNTLCDVAQRIRLKEGGKRNEHASKSE